MMGKEGENKNYLLRWCLLVLSGPFLGLPLVHLCVLHFQMWSFVQISVLSIFFSCSLAKCFSFYLFTYSLVDFLIVSMPNPYHKRYVHVVNLPQKSFQLLSYVVAKGLFSAGPILVWAHEFHKEFTQCAMCLDAHVI